MHIEFPPKNVSSKPNCEKKSDKSGAYWPGLLKNEPACIWEPPETAREFRIDVFSIASYFCCLAYESELARK